MKNSIQIQSTVSPGPVGIGQGGAAGSTKNQKVFKLCRRGGHWIRTGSQPSSKKSSASCGDGSCHGRAGSGGVAKSLQAGCRTQARNRHARGSKIRLDGSGSSVAPAGVDVQAPVIGIIGAGSDAPGSVPRIRKSGIRVRARNWVPEGRNPAMGSQI